MLFKRIFIVIAMVAGSAQASVTEWVDFKFTGSAIQIPVKIGGVQALATIDSKAKTNFLSESFVEKNQASLKKTGVILFKDQFGERNVSVYQDVNVQIFGSELPFRDIIAQQTPHADLTLGIPFFRQNIIQIDFPGRKLRLISRDQLDVKKIANVEMRAEINSKVQSVSGQQSIKKNDESNRAVKIKVNGSDQWLTFDTLAPAGVMMARSTAENNALIATPYAGDTKTMLSYFTLPAEFYALNTVKVGPYELENVLLAVEPSNGKRLIAPAQRQVKTGTKINREVLPEGAFGLDVMQHFIVTIDYTDSAVNFSVE
jgi:hypothetical protein